MSDLTWNGKLDEDEPVEEVDSTDEVASEEVEPPDEAETTETDDGEAPSEAPLIFGKYKSMEEAEKGYTEAVRALHESRQPQTEEVEEEVDQDPYGLWGTALGDGEAQQLAERLIQFPHEAQGIIEWVDENKAQFGLAGDQIADQLFQLWHAQNPRAAIRWDSQQQWTQHEAQIAEQNAPLQSHYTNQMAALAVHRATNGPDALPRFAEFKDQIMASITSQGVQAYLHQNPEFAKDPEKMFELLKGAWTNCVAQEYLANQQHAASASGEPAPGTPEKAKPRTQQRSTAAPPDSDDEVVGMFPAGTFRTG